MAEPTIGWTQAHVDHLNKMFPELTNEHDVNKLLVNSGKRAVVHTIQQLVNAGRKQVFHEH